MTCGCTLIHNFKRSSGGVTSVSVGNTLFVSKTGNDATGERENFAKHYLTIGAAITAASSGDIVQIFPGTYTEDITAKDGVRVFAFDGVNITGKISFGNGTHVFNGRAKITGNGDHAISITGNSSSTVSMEYLSCTGASGYRAISNTGSGYAEVTYARETVAGSAAGSLAIYTSNSNSFHYFGQVVTHVTGSTATDLIIADTGTGAMLLDIDQISRTDLGKRSFYSKAGNHRIYINLVGGYMQIENTGQTNIGSRGSFGAVKCEPAVNTVAPIVVSGTSSSVKIMNMKLAVTGATAGTVGVYASAAQTIILNGQIISNKAPHSNISFDGGGEYVHDTNMNTGNP